MPGLLVIVSGPSGVGKTTITRELNRRVAGSVFSVSVTTRPKTDADVEGRDYFFVGRERFAQMADAGELLEHADVFGHRYGTPRKWVEDRLAEGKVVILEIDVAGAEQVKAKMPAALAMFVEPPTEDVLLHRLRARRREEESVIRSRFAQAKREIERARTNGVYDVFIVNDDLETAIAEAVGVVERALRSAPGQSNRN